MAFPKNIVASKCKVCQRKSGNGTPLSKCFDCKKKFCHEHIWGGQVNAKMKENDPIRDLCNDCKKKGGYVHLKDWKKP
jgi:hypothetical protein